MIIARIESLIAGKPVSDALERAFAYVQAGADGIMIHSKNKSGEDIKEFCLAFRKQYAHVPIVVVPTTYDHIYEVHLLFPVHHASQSSKALENCILVHLQETAED